MLHIFSGIEKGFRCPVCGRFFRSERDAQECCYTNDIASVIEVPVFCCELCRFADDEGDPEPMCPHFRKGKPQDGLCPDFFVDTDCENSTAIQSAFEEEMRLHRYAHIPMFS